MVNRKFRKRLAVLLPAVMLATSAPMQIMAAELQEQETAENTEPVTEAPTEAPTEPQTEAPTEPPVTEPETEAPTETPDTEPETETESESDTETESESGTETESETTSEPDTETETESETESDTETESETESESESESEEETEETEEESEEETEEETEKPREGVPGFSVDPNAYPAVNITENTKEIYRFLIEELGLNHAAACGVLANIHLESNFNQLAVGDGGTSFGICQWHLGRLSNLMGVCGSLGLDYRTLEGQLAYLETELNGGYAHVLNYLRSVPDTAQGAYSAAYYWCMYFEIPSETEARSVQRGNLAMYEYFPQTFDITEKREKEDEKTIYRTTSNLNVRKEPSLEAEILGMLDEDTVIDVCEESKEWYRITYEDGFGYVSRDYVKVTVKEAEEIELYIPGLAEMKNTSDQKPTIERHTRTLMLQEMKLFQLRPEEKEAELPEVPEMEPAAEAKIEPEPKDEELTDVRKAEEPTEIVYKETDLPFNPLLIPATSDWFI